MRGTEPHSGHAWYGAAQQPCMVRSRTAAMRGTDAAQQSSHNWVGRARSWHVRDLPAHHLLELQHEWELPVQSMQDLSVQHLRELPARLRWGAASTDSAGPACTASAGAAGPDLLGSCQYRFCGTCLFSIRESCGTPEAASAPMASLNPEPLPTYGQVQGYCDVMQVLLLDGAEIEHLHRGVRDKARGPSLCIAGT